ncbi:(2Fe-2S)-binding protein [Candidatus Gracilibacteria bacterium]|nr:(2Fe-2S)-binding protein [Candidatus Gracilibacteria bacterium]
MPTVIINDVAYEAKPGERLLAVARRNAAHIGFVCDGQGICQTCQCRVIAGGESLNPISEAERVWMPESRLRAGHRLACQAAIRGRGPIKIITNAEELRRQLLDVLNPPANGVARDYLEPLLENLVRQSVDQVRRYPLNVLSTIARVGIERFLLPVRDGEQYLDDAARVTRRMSVGGAASAPVPAHPKTDERG